jgi:quercetin dioxygenase-like cupin family protein
MGLVTFDRDEGNLVSGAYSQARGPVLRSERIELTKVFFARGEGAKPHRHPEEQVMLVLKGRLRVTLDGETYEVGPGQATFNPSNAEHAVEALDDVEGISFKNLVDPNYDKTGDLA